MDNILFLLAETAVVPTVEFNRYVQGKTIVLSPRFETLQQRRVFLTSEGGRQQSFT